MLRRERQLIGGFQLLLRSLALGTIAYCPRGPVLADDDPVVVNAVLDAMMDLARRRRVLYAKVQPPAGRGDLERALCQRGFVASDLPAAPVGTVVIDLRAEPEELLRRMRARGRTYLRQALREGVVVRAAGRSGLAAFADLLESTSQRQGFRPYPVEHYHEMLGHFGSRAELLLAEHSGRALAGVVLVGYGDTVVYKMGAWSGRGSGVHPNELLHWHAMQWARDRGYRYYDLEGIEPAVARAVLAGDAVPEAGRRGATRFKLGLGGHVVMFPQAYDRSFRPLLAWPIRLMAPRSSRLKSLAHQVVGRAR